MFRRRNQSPEKIVTRKITYARFMERVPEVLRLLPVSLSTWWDHWLDTILVSLLWVVSLILFPLNPPATFGLYYALQDPKEIGDRPKMMWEGFKQYAGVAYLNTLLTLLVLVISYFNWIFYTAMENQWLQLLSSFSITILFLWGMVQFYLIPTMLQQEEKKLFLAYRNAFSVFMASPIFGLIAVIFYLLLGIISYVFPPLLFFGTPIALAMLNFFTVQNRLIKMKAVLPASALYQYDPAALAEDLLAVLDNSRLDAGKEKK